MTPKALEQDKCGAAGALLHRVTLQSESRASDGSGGDTLSWNDVDTLPAKVIPISGRERLFAQRLEASISHVVYIRWRDGVTAKHRLLFKGRAFNIRAPINLEELNEWLELHCEEGVAT